ncbi:hypothetical protein PROFUN_02222 [Planoprotostelium fungivorum]|uniref:Serine/threonine-protein kinase RIO2 n=1 Tax=Planoprotostelium fungivorum TaxID=1890364 RepID=A0A2P6NZK2_9EUKA|nr:hypothetical protein PROFUN_13855 [Planoprotostelium fungivorum]PRP89348.1 hypothetical protein PROFUN_02222 [Planoprotostelium fungivorum]
MRLDVTLLRYLSRDEFRALTAIEIGMKNHELVPTSLIIQIAHVKHGGTKKAITTLHKNKLVWHDSKKYDGYRLTYQGYDFLALRTLCSRGILSGMATKLGVGKESDLYIGINAEGVQVAIKFARLGRTSFRSIKNNRDYLEHRKSASWLYLSRLASLKEYAFMKALYENGFPTPVPIDWNRHVVVMSLVNGYLLANVKRLIHPGRVYSDLMNLIVRFASYGLIHCDFNEFNIMINDEEKVTVIDFPQMVSTSHANAEMYFNRDVNCIRIFFEKKFGYVGAEYPVFNVDTEREFSLDVQVAASGFSSEDAKKLDALMEELKMNEEEAEEDDDEDSDEEDDQVMSISAVTDSNAPVVEFDERVSRRTRVFQQLLTKDAAKEIEEELEVRKQLKKRGVHVTNKNTTKLKSKRDNHNQIRNGW